MKMVMKIVMKIVEKRLITGLFICLLGMGIGLAGPASAQSQRLYVTEGQIEPIPVAIADFTGLDGLPSDVGRQITQIISEDLVSSGLFLSIDSAAFIAPPASPATPDDSNRPRARTLSSSWDLRFDGPCRHPQRVRRGFHRLSALHSGLQHRCPSRTSFPVTLTSFRRTSTLTAADVVHCTHTAPHTHSHVLCTSFPSHTFSLSLTTFSFHKLL